MKRVLILTVLVLTLVLAGCNSERVPTQEEPDLISAELDQDIVTLLVELRTTSDYADLEFLFSDFILDMQLIEVIGEPAYTSLERERLELDQDPGAVNGQSEVGVLMRYEINTVLTPLPESRRCWLWHGEGRMSSASPNSTT